MLLYHATPKENFSSIMQNGLQANKLGFVFLAEHKDMAATFLYLRGVTDLVVFTVDVDESEVEESFDHNEEWFKRVTNYDSCRCYVFKGNIHKDRIDWSCYTTYNFTL